MFGFVAAVLGFFALLVIAYLRGPRVRVVDRVEEPQLPALSALEAWIAAREAAVPALHSGCEKRIRWAGAPAVRTPLALLYVHGFSATRREISPVVERLAERRAANAYFARLRGHGRDEEAFGSATVNDWLHDTLEAYRIAQRLGERVVLIGTSTGACLALWLAMRNEPGIAALVLISPNFGPRDRRAEFMLGPWGVWLARQVTGGYREVPVKSEEHARVWQTRQPAKAVVEMMALVDYVRRMDLERIWQPTLVLYSPHDGTVDPRKMLAHVERLGSESKRLVDMTAPPRPQPGHPHVLAGDILSPQTTQSAVDEMDAFLRSALHLHAPAAPE